MSSSSTRPLKQLFRFCNRPLQQFLERIAIELRVTQDARQQPWADRLAGMDRNNRNATVRVTKEVVTAFDPRHHKAGTSKRRHKLLALN
jgi:hypothetical protein